MVVGREGFVEKLQISENTLALGWSQLARSSWLVGVVRLRCQDCKRSSSIAHSAPVHIEKHYLSTTEELVVHVILNPHGGKLKLGLQRPRWKNLLGSLLLYSEWCGGGLTVHRLSHQFNDDVGWFG